MSGLGDSALGPEEAADASIPVLQKTFQERSTVAATPALAARSLQLHGVALTVHIKARLAQCRLVRVVCKRQRDAFHFLDETRSAIFGFAGGTTWEASLSGVVPAYVRSHRQSNCRILVIVDMNTQMN
jgi:hypothetical protein